MPNGYPPSVFVSSTCFDLGQVRLELKAFIESLGYVPVISENSAFPVNPQADNLENCIRAVRDRADIFVLIVGSRYGSQAPDGRSITNHEYQEARGKGVPLFVFVAQNILHTLPIWQANPTADFLGSVDSPKLFEFVQHLRERERNWVFPFNNADDISQTLRMQLAILFTNALQERERLRTAKLSPELLGLPASCLSILLQKPPGWEYRFFSAVLKSEFEQHASLRRDVQYGLQLGVITQISEIGKFTDWVIMRIAELEMLVESSNRLINSAFSEAVGPIGQPGHPELLAYVARRLAEVYSRLLSWTNNFASVSTDPEFKRMMLLTSQFAQDVIEKLESFSGRIDSMMEEADAARTRGEKYSGEIMVVLNFTTQDEFTVEMKRLCNLVLSGSLH